MSKHIISWEPQCLFLLFLMEWEADHKIFFRICKKRCWKKFMNWNVYEGLQMSFFFEWGTTLTFQRHWKDKSLTFWKWILLSMSGNYTIHFYFYHQMIYLGPVMVPWPPGWMMKYVNGVGSLLWNKRNLLEMSTFSDLLYVLAYFRPLVIFEQEFPNW